MAGICCLCLVFSLGGLAAVPDLAVRLSSVSADTLALFTPLDESCESSGIRAEVIAALSDGDTALFCWNGKIIWAARWWPQLPAL